MSPAARHAGSGLWVSHLRPACWGSGLEFETRHLVFGTGQLGFRTDQIEFGTGRLRFGTRHLVFGTDLLEFGTVYVRFGNWPSGFGTGQCSGTGVAGKVSGKRLAPPPLYPNHLAAWLLLVGRKPTKLGTHPFCD